MKYIIYALIAFLCLAGTRFMATATIRTVNNSTDPVNPGQYNSINYAIGASSAGDTILVAGSATAYDSTTITIDKQLVLVGAGYNPKGANTNPTIINQQINMLPAASGSVLMGFAIAQGIYFTNTSGGSKHTNISFLRNMITQSCHFFVDSTTNIIFINNIIKTSIVFEPFEVYTAGCGFYNNVFTDGSYLYYYGETSRVINPLVVDHNLFSENYYGETPPSAASLESQVGVYNSTFTSNIFYCSLPYWSVCSATSGGVDYLYNSNNMLNNIDYTTGSGSIPDMGTYYTACNSGSGNLDNTNPGLASFAHSSANPYLDFSVDNISLTSGSPCINAGYDGTNIGPTGGLYPIYNTDPNYLTGEPPLPSVRSMTGATTVSRGSTLNVTVNVTEKR